MATNSETDNNPTATRATAAAAVRRMTMLGAAVAAFSCLYVLSFGYAMHAPHPHDVRIDVVAPPGTAEQVRQALDVAEPGAFDVRPVATDTEARAHIEHMDTSGALVEVAGGSAHVLTAGAAGASLQQAVTTALTNVAQAQGYPVVPIDVVPLPDGDRGGLSAFALELGLLVPAIVGAIGLLLIGRRARIWARVVGAVAYAVLAGTLGAVMLDASLGALTGAPWALFGDAVLIAGAFVLSVAALHVLFGLPGTGLAVGALIVVGNAVNGAAVPTTMLPNVYRQIAPWTPNNAAVHLIRSDIYFDGHDQGGPLLTLTIWLVAAVLIIAAVDLVQRRKRQPRAIV